ncbi:MAG: LptF/LptG family permease [Candidatus Sericytochromatia bacterium]
MLKIFDKYLFSELIKPFIAGVSLSVVLLVANSFFLYLKMVNDTNLPIYDALKLFVFQIPSWIVLAFPMGYLFSSLLVVGRLSKDYELTAFQSCGISLLRASFPILLLSFLVSLGAFFINETIAPSANYQSKMIYIDIATNPKILPLKEKTFFDIKKDKKFMYVGDLNKDTGLFKNIFIFDAKDDMFPKIITAKKGIRNGEKIILNDGVLKKYNKEAFLNYEVKFREMEIAMTITPDSYDPKKGVTDLPFFQSKALVEEFQKEVEKDKTKLQELNEKKVYHNNKLSLPLATFFSTLLSIPLGMLFVKRSLFIGLALSIAIIFIWNVSFQISSSLGKVGTLDPFLASWVQNLAFLALGLPMFFYLSKK